MIAIEYYILIIATDNPPLMRYVYDTEINCLESKQHYYNNANYS